MYVNRRTIISFHSVQLKLELNAAVTNELHHCCDQWTFSLLWPMNSLVAVTDLSQSANQMEHFNQDQQRNNNPCVILLEGKIPVICNSFKF